MGGYFCLCVVLLQLSGPLQDVSAGTSPLRCKFGTTLCSDGSECILYNHLCDGEPDCKDGSDEENCASVCNEDQFQCAHGKKCIDKDQVCDGISQCQDRSDERECSKKPEGCVHYCDNRNRCLPESFLCDGEKDCLDGTDEANCDKEERIPAVSVPTTTTSSHPVECSLGLKLCEDKRECVRYSHICDGEPDCSDGSDEEDCSTHCEKDQFQCAHGKKCVEQSQVCDGVSQCRDGSDELECFKPTKSCAHQCGDKNRCIPSSFICDGERDCLDGSDEANCGVEVCSASDFKCTSGQCVSDKVRCDGYPDCQDQSDEDQCPKPPVCITKQLCPQSKECLVQEWICDGHQDCKDGTDEKDCPVAQMNCGEFQWSCKSKTKCIPTAWRCDKMMDCDDGTDEAECKMEGCLPHLFQCGDGECLDPVLVCNGFPNCGDGSDEGGSCQIKCTDVDKKRCSQSCHSTPKGTSCGCGPGYRLSEDGFTCVDMDECEGQSPGVCSQICRNTPGSYQCDCHPGYVMETNGHSCKIIGEPLLLSSVLNDLFLIGLHSGRVDVLSSSADKAILSLDYDWKEQRVFWDSLDTASIGWSSLEEKTTGTLIKGVRADSVAVDWLGRNLYWIDGVNSQIVAIKLPTATLNPLDQSVILDEDLDQPRSLALLPQKGLMFWTEIGNAVKIERAGMDGSERRAVVNSSLGWPGGVTVDPMSDRVYWTDVRLRAIGSATLDGDDIKILQMKDIANPFSLAVFNDMLYWSDSKKRMVQAVHKITGKKQQVLLKRPRQPFALKIIHPQLQMEAENPCEKKECSHLCILAPGPVAVCKCPSGLLLADDGLTCSSLVNSAFLLMQSSSTITQIYLQSRHTSDLKGWPEHVALQLPSIKAAILDYSLRDHTLYLTDDSTTSLSSFKLKESNLTSHSELLKLLGDTITAMALDWVTLNMYWSSNKQQRLQVSSFTDAQTAVLIKDGIGRIESIVLHPQSGRVCFTNLVLTGTDTVVTVECADMDGAERSVVWKDGVRPTSLVFSSSGESIYWADTSLGTIGSIQLNDHKYNELKVGDGLAAVALSDDLLLWMTISDKTRLWYRDEHEQNKLWFEVGSEVISLKAFSKSSQTGSNQCSHNNGNCQHLCLATPGGRTCRCAHDHVLVNKTHCHPNQQHCPAGGRMCVDELSCQPVGKFCNGHVDCADHSDENCFSVEQRSGEAPDPTQPQSSASPLPSLPTVSEEPGLTTTLNTSIQLADVNVKECGESRCGGRGQCVEVDGKTACVCSLLYSGESCQDSLLSMRSPVVYGAAACVVLVVVVVIAVVLKKKRGNSRRANPEKETNMTDLEKKAESPPSTQTVPADADKPEEVVSPVD